MPENLAMHGLCGACANAAECTHRRQAGGPVLQCEEFELYRLPPRRPAGQNSAPVGLRLSADAGEEDSGKHTGLCQDCENRRVCTFPRLEGGVWHCEEYR